MGASAVKDDYQRHHLSMSPSPQPPPKYGQFSLEPCDTPPPEKTPTTKDLNSAQRGSAFAREVHRLYSGGITPRKIRVSASHPVDTSNGRWTGTLHEVETSHQQSDDPFIGGSIPTSPFGAEITARKSHNRVLSNDSEVEIVRYPRKHSVNTSHNRGIDTLQLQASSGNLLGSKEVSITDVSPGTYHTNHFLHGEQLVFSHVKVKKPRSAPQPDKESTRKRKRKVRDEYLIPLAGQVIGDDTGRKLALKFREDANRWWNIVVNPTGRWVDSRTWTNRVGENRVLF